MRAGYKHRQSRKRFRFPLLFLLTFLVNSGYLQQVCSAQPGIRVNIQKNLQRLIQQEDTDGDKKITIDDRFVQADRGDKKFQVMGENGQRYEVLGTYYLSNLLQQLKLSEGKGLSVTALEPEKIFENPVTRISRCLGELYFDHPN